MASAASFIAFRVGAEDAPLLAAHLCLKPDTAMSSMGYRSTEPVEQLVRLPDFHACARTLIDDTPTEATFPGMLPPPSSALRPRSQGDRTEISRFLGSAQQSGWWT